MSSGRRIANLYPFTFAGTILFVLALYLLGLSWNSGNIFALTFAFLSLVFLFTLTFFARLQAIRFSEVRLIQDTARPLFARLQGMEQIYYMGKIRPLYFFRLHLILKGSLDAGRDTPLYFRAEAAGSGGGEIRIPVRFPTAGLLETEERMLVRDIFGFVRAPFGRNERRSCVVRSPLFGQGVPDRFLSMFSEDHTSRRRSSDEEKYYMREYIPGDRLKEINWKASVRVEELITRISPLSYEESHLLTVEFRHFSRITQDTPESLIHLNYLKSWVLSFISGVKRRYPSFEFVVFTGIDSWHLKDDDDFERLAIRLSSLGYMAEPATPASADVPPDGVRFIFSTIYDENLAAYIGARPKCTFHLFRTIRGSGGGARVVRFFNRLSPDLLPGTWIFRGGLKKQPPVAQVRGTLVQEALSVKLL